MAETEADGERVWESGWEGHSTAQRRRLARLPLTEKLRWLEEAHALVMHLARARKGNGQDESR